MINKGFLILSEITGYTAYLSKSELDHAQGTLTDLFKALIKTTVSPLVISKLEGDAVFSYIPDNTNKYGQIIVESIKNIYLAFRQEQ